MLRLTKTRKNIKKIQEKLNHAIRNRLRNRIN